MILCTEKPYYHIQHSPVAISYLIAIWTSFCLQPLWSTHTCPCTFIICCAYLLISSHGFVISCLSSHYFHCGNSQRYSITHALPLQLLTWSAENILSTNRIMYTNYYFKVTKIWIHTQTLFMDRVIFIYPTNRDRCTQTAPITYTMIPVH